MSNFYQPKYTSLAEIKLELKGKITFSNTNTTYMSDNEVLNNIKSGEAAVERYFSRQYITIPSFLGVDGEDFDLIPDIYVATVDIVRKLSTLKTCIYIMHTKFGKADGVRGQGYLENYKEDYRDLLAEIIEKDDKSGQWLYPPLPGLKLNPNASFYEPGIMFPALAKVGSTSGSLTQQVVGRMIDPTSNWWFRNCGRNGFNRHFR